MRRQLLLTLLLLLVVPARAVAFSYTGDGSDGFVATEQVTAANMNEIDTALDALEADLANEAGLEAQLGNVNILLETEIDASSELLAIMDDETGTGALVFATAPTLSGTITIGGTSLIETGAALAFGDGTDATLTHTYANTGTDVTIAYSTAQMTVTGGFDATDIGGITLANLVDKSAAETIAGAWDLGTPSAVVLTNASGTASSLTAGTASVATTLTITDNESTAETNAILFTAGGDLDGGNLGIESDGDLTYNPSTGVLTATSFSASASDTAEVRLTSATGSDEIAIDLDDNGTTTSMNLSVDDATGDDQVYIELDGATDRAIFGTAITLLSEATPTTDADGEIAVDTDGWGTGYDAIEFYNGTASAYVVATTATDTPTNGQVPKWNTGGTITWENDTSGGVAGTTFEECFVIYAPSAEVQATDDVDSIWRAAAALTITEVWCETDTGTVNADLQIDDGTPADVMGADLACAATAVSDSTGLSGAMADGDRLDLEISSVATNPTRLTFCIEYDYD